VRTNVRRVGVVGRVLSDGKGLVHALGHLFTIEPRDFRRFLGGVRCAIDYAATEDERDDASRHALMDAAEGYWLYRQAGFLADFTDEPIRNRLGQAREGRPGASGA